MPGAPVPICSGSRSAGPPRAVLLALLAASAVSAMAPLAAPSARAGDTLPPEGIAVNSFEAKGDLSWLSPGQTRVSLTQDHVTDGLRALLVDFRPTEWPGVMFRPERPWDWSEGGKLQLDVTNPGDTPATFYLRIDASTDADGGSNSRTGSGTVAPGATERFTMPASAETIDLGMRGQPNSDAGKNMGAFGSGAFDVSRVVGLNLFMASPGESTSLIFDNLRLLPDAYPVGIVDEFGQYSKAEWPGKVKSSDDLKERGVREGLGSGLAKPGAGRDRFGGWAKGPKLRSTGYFRTERVGGKWWLVDPDGRLFFSTGLDCMVADQATMVTGRERMFSWLPDGEDPLYDQFRYTPWVHSGPTPNGETFSFHAANLQRKYGPGYWALWASTALDRLLSWGFNTIGNWSDPGLSASKRAPYVANGTIGGNHDMLDSYQTYLDKMHDPFSPQFTLDARATAEGIAEQVGRDPWCLGVFVDNELNWGDMTSARSRYGLVLSALSSTPLASPAKRVFLRRLTAEYVTIDRLNTAWGTAYADWRSLEAPMRLSEPFSQRLKSDLSSLSTSLAAKYFSVVKSELRRVLPNHLYLGCRFAGRTDEAVAAAAGVCDVLSFNIYQPSISPADWGFLDSLGRPCIIGEFHIGSLDRGMFHPGFVSAPDQAARGAAFENYVGSVLDNPSFVGCHWFQYADEPLTGRYSDGENFGVGFVSVTDSPYPELVDSARGILSRSYERRYLGSK